MIDSTFASVRHGHYLGYVADGCRCDQCRRAWYRYDKRVRHDRATGSPHTIPALGTHRRLQALMAAGWNAALLAREAGRAERWVSNILARQRVNRTTARRVIDLYDRLWDQPPPQGTSGQKAAVTIVRRLARERGWLLPMALDDDRIDDPAWTPDRVSDRRTTTINPDQREAS